MIGSRIAAELGKRDELLQSKLGPTFAKLGVEMDQLELTESFSIERG